MTTKKETTKARLLLRLFLKDWPLDCDSLIRVQGVERVVNVWAQAAVSSLQEAALVTLVDLVASFVAAYVIGMSVTSVLGLVLLLEAVALMLVGGAFDLGGAASTKRLFAILTRKRFDWSPQEHKTAQSRGAVYTLIGVLLFVEALALALVTLP